MSSSRRKILSLYRNILRESKKFTSYNFRSYALQRTKDAFKENKSESSPEKIQALIKKAEDNLDMIKRQVLIGQMYGEGHLIIENKEHMVKS